MLLMWLSFIWLHLFSRSLCQQQHVSTNQQTVLAQPLLRNATMDDAGDIADAVLAAFAPADHWNYMYPYRREFAKEHRRCMVESMQAVIAQPEDKRFVQVATMPTDKSSKAKAIAVGMWFFPESNPTSIPTILEVLSKCPSHDANITRFEDFNHQVHAAKLKYIDELYHGNYIYLGGLATHADYQGLGAGSLLLRSGIALAREFQLDVTLIATEEGEPVYSYVGFESISNFTVTTLDKDNGFRFDAMFYNMTSDMKKGTVKLD